MQTADLFIAALIMLMGLSKKAKAMTPEKAADALDKISKLQTRANQQQALDWIPDLEKAGASPDLARALARWIGIESSGYPAGNPKSISKLGERGLLQISPATAKEALTAGEWQALGDPATTRAMQTQIALKQYKWHRERAKKWVKTWPGDDTFDSVFYAKMHHQRPKDLSDFKPVGTAAKDSRAMGAKWTSDPAALQRIAAANVVTWGSVTPP
jgi:hypothetical protein